MNIEIRRVEPGDYKAVCEIHAQPNALRGTLQLPFPSEEMWKKRLEGSGDERYMLVACIEGEIVAMGGLDLFPKSPRRRHAAHIGLAVHDKWQAKGVGTALMKALIDVADNWLNLSRLELSVFTDNEPALKLYKKLGFVVEGTHKKFAFRDGEHVDAYTMARVR
jgi:L-phenylalanine/L-methionine N-acetyltransferase